MPNLAEKINAFKIQFEKEADANTLELMALTASNITYSMIKKI